MKISLVGITLFITFFFSSNLVAAQLPNSPLFNRLCKSWAIEKLEDNGQVEKADDAQMDYRLIFNADSTMMQGLSPDGFIPGVWKLDEKNMVITIKDTKTNSTYRLKIIKISTDELILQNLDDAKSLVIYYKAV